MLFLPPGIRRSLSAGTRASPPLGSFAPLPLCPGCSIKFHGRKTGAEGRFQSAQQVRPCDVSDEPFGFFCSTLNTIRAFNDDGPVVVTLYKAAKTTRSSNDPMTLDDGSTARSAGNAVAQRLGHPVGIVHAFSRLPSASLTHVKQFGTTQICRSAGYYPVSSFHLRHLRPVGVGWLVSNRCVRHRPTYSPVLCPPLTTTDHRRHSSGSIPPRARLIALLSHSTTSPWHALVPDARRLGKRGKGEVSIFVASGVVGSSTNKRKTCRCMTHTAA